MGFLRSLTTPMFVSAWTPGAHRLLPSDSLNKLLKLKQNSQDCQFIVAGSCCTDNITFFKMHTAITEGKSSSPPSYCQISVRGRWVISSLVSSSVRGGCGSAGGAVACRTVQYPASFSHMSECPWEAEEKCRTFTTEMTEKRFRPKGPRPEALYGIFVLRK